MEEKRLTIKRLLKLNSITVSKKLMTRKHEFVSSISNNLSFYLFRAENKGFLEDFFLIYC